MIVRKKYELTNLNMGIMLVAAYETKFYGLSRMVEEKDHRVGNFSGFYARGQSL